MSGAEYDLTFDKVVSGKSDPIKLQFVLTDIGTKEDPDFDNYVFSIQLPGMEPDARENVELRAQGGKTVGDVTWKNKYPVVGEAPDPQDEDNQIETYRFPELIIKTSDVGYPMGKVSVSKPFEAVLTTDNWTD